MLPRSRHISVRFTLPKYYCIRGMGYAKIEIFRGNKKEQVLDNLAEKMDKCPAVELGVPRYPLKKKREKRKKMIAHGPSNKQYASKS